jgi:hypothetical protein
MLHTTLNAIRAARPRVEVYSNLLARLGKAEADEEAFAVTTVPAIDVYVAIRAAYEEGVSTGRYLGVCSSVIPGQTVFRADPWLSSHAKTVAEAVLGLAPRDDAPT